jgi:aspartyl/asparaginyl beta-hydroxylase (cupin superfamily)|tara:strand:- start:1092 stop:1616 length:525 start_codon:yes stop_codon:yes gene_type:complete
METFNFNYIEKVNISSFQEKVLAIKNWDKYQHRQKTYEVHRQTKTIPLIFDEDFREENLTYHEDYYKFKKNIETVKKVFDRKLGKGYIVRAILVNLLSNSKINEHMDSGYSLESCNRIHIPIITNNEVYFTVGGERKNLKDGEMWQINNNNKMHSVENNSNQDRIHLITDWKLL